MSKPLVIAGDDLKLITYWLYQGAGVGIKRARELHNELQKVSELSSPKIGYWGKYKDGDDWVYVECSECGTDIPDLGKENDVDMVNLARYYDFPNYCSHCGAKMGVALTPSDYYTFLKEQGCGKGEERVDDFLSKMTRIMEQDKFDYLVYSTEEEGLEAFEVFNPDILFDLEGNRID